MIELQPEDILVLGDSFCAERERETDWPVRLVQRLTKKSEAPRGKGYRGNHWWSYRKAYFEEVDKQVPKVVVICHTDATRIPSKEDHPLNAGSVFAENNTSPLSGHEARRLLEPDLLKAAEGYYQHLHFDQYAAWANRQWQKELCASLEQLAVPYVLHLHCFPPWWENTESYIGIPYALDYGMTNTVSLYNLLLENPDSHGTRNHFTPAANESIAEALSRVIKYGYHKVGFDDFNLLAYLPK
jgi:hypothetical protein